MMLETTGASNHITILNTPKEQQHEVDPPRCATLALTFRVKKAEISLTSGYSILASTTYLKNAVFYWLGTVIDDISRNMDPALVDFTSCLIFSFKNQVTNLQRLYKAPSIFQHPSICQVLTSASPIHKASSQTLPASTTTTTTSNLALKQILAVAYIRVGKGRILLLPSPPSTQLPLTLPPLLPLSLHPASPCPFTLLPLTIAPASPAPPWCPRLGLVVAVV
ncbi:hypothetical protein Pcinc_011643 [Petrolisthes cinctipes]|uniref:Uncharacterized protein n=1 Tax=Petrolisthes cinctipes TaxID=88211 RepID=A0AAE1KU85_PETCI|nr:hypothetical protein Pcinc_011643 [Petrolisthes cinctipes]